jgi:hypothetical protein
MVGALLAAIEEPPAEETADAALPPDEVATDESDEPAKLERLSADDAEDDEMLPSAEDALPVETMLDWLPVEADPEETDDASASSRRYTARLPSFATTPRRIRPAASFASLAPRILPTVKPARGGLCQFVPSQRLTTRASPPLRVRAATQGRPEASAVIEIES